MANFSYTHIVQRGSDRAASIVPIDLPESLTFYFAENQSFQMDQTALDGHGRAPSPGQSGFEEVRPERGPDPYVFAKPEHDLSATWRRFDARREKPGAHWWTRRRSVAIFGHIQLRMTRGPEGNAELESWPSECIRRSGTAQRARTDFSHSSHQSPLVSAAAVSGCDSLRLRETAPSGSPARGIVTGSSGER